MSRLLCSRAIVALYSQCRPLVSQNVHPRPLLCAVDSNLNRKFLPERFEFWRQLPGDGRFYSTLYRRTLLMKQFENTKKQYKDYILLFQVGEFYEIYGDDASEVTSKTSLRLASKNNIFMAGFPVKALSEWQRTLVEAGFQLAICDQIPSRENETSRLMTREVVKLVTPGTLIEPLDQQANYLLSIATGPSYTLGLAWIDISTSEFQVSSSEVGSIDEDLERLCPSEVLLAEDVVSAVRQGKNYQASTDSSVEGLVKSTLLKECHLTAVQHSWFSGDTTASGRRYSDKLQQLFDSLRTDNYSTLEIAAASALLHFVMHTQRGVVPYLSSPSPFSHGQHMAINANTRRALELVSPLHNNPSKATLLGCIDRTVTAAGARLLKARLSSPLVDVAAVRRRLEAVELFSSRLALSEELVGLLKRCADLERIVQKVATNSVNVTDLQAIKNTLTTAGTIIDFLNKSLPDTSALHEDIEGLQHFPQLTEELERSLSGNTYGDYFMSGYSEEVDSLRHKLKTNEAQVNNLVTHLGKSYRLSKLTVAAHRGYIRVLEVPKSQAPLAEKCPELIKVDYTQAKTRFSHLQLQKLNAEMQQLESAYTQTQDKLFQELCNKVMCEAEAISHTARALARLDVSSSLGMLAAERGYCKPELVEAAVLDVRGGVHPVVASLQRSSFVGNDCCMDQHTLWIVTGPNMGGKSTFLRQNALIAILAQMGSFVPAESARLGVVDRLFARVGASDNVARHMSTFHMEMSETASILSNATQRSFVILDEIGRGTSTSEGLSIAQAVVEHLHNNIGCRTLVATHFHQLASLSEHLPRAVCYKLVARRENDGIIFTYQIQPGSAQHSFAIDVAYLAGIPGDVISRSKELLCAVEMEKPLQQFPVTALSDCTGITGSHPHTLSHSQQECLKCLETVSLDTTTPMEALNMLHKLKQLLQE